MWWLAAHLLGDFFLQTPQEATGKLWSCKLLTTHVAKYTLAMSIPVFRYENSYKKSLLIILLIFVTHWLTDLKRWLPDEEWAPGMILNDQMLHAFQLAIFNEILSGGDSG